MPACVFATCSTGRRLCGAVSAARSKVVPTGARQGVIAKADKSDSNVIDKPSTTIDIEKLNSLLKKQPPMYRVLLHNDNMNRREYVVQTLLRVVEGLTVDDAVNVMQEAHINGIALVTIVSQEIAEQYVTSLRRNGLTSTLEPSGGDSGNEN